MTHTPGPWEAKQTAVGITTITSVIMTNDDGLRFLNNINNVAISKDEAQANAQLIAAVPDLLDAVKRLILAFDVGDIAHTTLNGRGYPALADARQVLAKAEGDA